MKAHFWDVKLGGELNRRRFVRHGRAIGLVWPSELHDFIESLARVGH